ncbi:DUF4215 domain-containing protein [Nanoarchaeota archaeon]
MKRGKFKLDYSSFSFVFVVAVFVILIVSLSFSENVYFSPMTKEISKENLKLFSERDGFLEKDENPFCGDGVLDYPEECDDGNLASGDNCDENCIVENPVCGDSFCSLSVGEDACNCEDDCGQFQVCCYDVDANENFAHEGECCSLLSPRKCKDKYGWDENYVCIDYKCQDSVCGDGIKDVPNMEYCDDGNTENGDGCDENCQWELGALCGDEEVQSELGEECDDGRWNSDMFSDRCRLDCTLPRCGDGIRDSVRGEECDKGEENGEGWEFACLFS